MLDCFSEARSGRATSIVPLRREELQRWRQKQSDACRRWLDDTDFRAEPGSVCLVPDAGGRLERVVVGVRSRDHIWALAALPMQLPAGKFRLAAELSPTETRRAAIGWGLGAYDFSRYRRKKRRPAKLVIGSRQERQEIENIVSSIYLVRDLINTPAEDMMPEHLGTATAREARAAKGRVAQIIGDRLLERNYPAIHTVGRASAHAPRLIDLRWGQPRMPKLTLVGKGVCFDSGGLDLKSAAGMRLMKKDMGGAAHALGLARMVMRAALPVRLRVLVPAVENAVSGTAYRPGDIVRTRLGTSVEIDNTDAEGRVVLCDALAEGAREEPDLMIDFATLTGAARVALGTDLPALFCNQDQLADELMKASAQAQDPFWRLPLHEPYREMLDSPIADMVNSASAPFGGAITAALFLQAFVPQDTPWAHFDLMAWNTRSRPGRPEGGEAMGLRALFAYLCERFAPTSGRKKRR